MLWVVSKLWRNAAKSWVSSIRSSPITKKMSQSTGNPPSILKANQILKFHSLILGASPNNSSLSKRSAKTLPRRTVYLSIAWIQVFLTLKTSRIIWRVARSFKIPITRFRGLIKLWSWRFRSLNPIGRNRGGIPICNQV